MVDQERVCCLCGDVGFPDKLFQCCRCRFRLQHSYCSNYYYGNETSSTTPRELCDWCLSEGRNSSSTSNNNKHNHGVSSSSKRSSSSSSSMDIHARSEYSSRDRVKQQNQDNHTANNNTTASSASERGTPNKNSGIPSPRTGTHRRYKLLKDVMC